MEAGRTFTSLVGVEAVSQVPLPSWKTDVLRCTSVDWHRDRIAEDLGAQVLHSTSDGGHSKG